MTTGTVPIVYTSDDRRTGLLLRAVTAGVALGLTFQLPAPFGDPADDLVRVACDRAYVQLDQRGEPLTHLPEVCVR